MSTNSGLSETALRREARRRRILENSESRLKTITGSAKSDVEHNHVYLRKPFAFDNAQTHVHREDTDPCLEDEPNRYGQDTSFAADIGAPTPLSSDDVKEYGAPTPLSSDDVKEYGPPRIVPHQLYYVFLALAVFALIKLNVGSLFNENILTPFCGAKVMEVVLLKRDGSSSQGSALSAALALSGISPTALSFATRYLSLVTNITRDLFLYLFVFIVCYQLNHYSQ